jgi:hypothetical protein
MALLFLWIALFAGNPVLFFAMRQTNTLVIAFDESSSRRPKGYWEEVHVLRPASNAFCAFTLDESDAPGRKWPRLDPMTAASRPRDPRPDKPFL